MKLDTYRDTDTGWTVVDYTTMRVGWPLGDTQVVCCPKCNRNGMRKGKTVIHVQQCKRSLSGKLHAQVLVECKAALPKEPSSPDAQTGLALVPK